MVNTGKPSPGCFACRTRRIKCDTTRPECRKCRKRGWKCPGYRDLNALRIVDETQKQFTRFSGDKEKDEDEAATVGGPSQGVIIRQYAPPPPGLRRSSKRASSSSTTATAANASASSYPSPISQASSPNASPSSPLRYKTTNHHTSSSSSSSSIASPGPFSSSASILDDHHIPHCIGPNVAEHVYAYFLQNFVQGSSLRNHGYLDFLFPLLANNPSGERGHPLPLAFTAAAIISFAARQKVPELLPKAEAIYLRALESTFRAIGDSSRARDNSTLACVTLLTTFEQLRPSRPSHQKAEAFGSHLDGAVALLKMRGKDLFQTVVGRKIFLILRSLLVSRSICYATPLDPELYNLTSAFEQEPFARRFAELSLRAADTRVAVERLLGGWGPTHPDPDAQGPPTRDAVEHLWHACQALEADYQAHLRTLPLAWKAMTMRYLTAADRPIMGGIAYVGRIDAYIDMFICYILNWARAARLYIRNTALRCLAWLVGPEQDYREGPEYEASAALGQAIVEDIVASVPYVFGAARLAGGGQGEQQQPEAQPYHPPSLAGVFCMWPVFAAASSDFATETQRAFLKKTLKYISEEMGIGQAAILAGYNLRSPSMPIAFTRMKQFESQGKQLHGVASGAAAASVMTGGIKDLIKTTGSVMKTPPNVDPRRAIPIRTLTDDDDDDDNNENENDPNNRNGNHGNNNKREAEVEVDFPKFEFRGDQELPTWRTELT